MGASGVSHHHGTSTSCSPASRSLRQWFFFGRSLCRDVAACSPSPFSRSSSSSQSSSRAGSIRSSGHFSFRNDSPSKSLIPHHRRTPRRTPPKPGGNSKRGAEPPAPKESEDGARELLLLGAKGDSAAGGYAIALADLANAGGCLDAVNKDVEHLAELLDNDEVYTNLTSAAPSDVEHQKSIVRTIADEGRFHECSSTFLYALLERKRILLVKDVLREFEKIYNELTDTEVAIVTSASKMDAAELLRMAEKVKSLSGAAKVKAKNVVDPSLIAGYVIKYDQDGTKYIDMSVKGQLNRLAPQFESPMRSSTR